MVLSINSTLKDLLADEKAVAILKNAMDASEQAFNEVVNSPQMQQAMGMSLKELAGYSQGEITEEMLKGIDEELGKL